MGFNSKTMMTLTVSLLISSFALVEAQARVPLTDKQKKECETSTNPDLLCDPRDRNIGSGKEKPPEQTEAVVVPEEQRRNVDCPACRLKDGRMQDNTGVQPGVSDGSKEKTNRGLQR